jgi:hypothetical protein
VEILIGFSYGVLGGFFAELLGLFQLRKQAPGSLPQFLKSWFYWVITLAMILAGGILVVIYLSSDIPVKPILAVNIGASAPLLIGTFVAQTPSISPGKVD